jgi:hypothetical protein
MSLTNLKSKEFTQGYEAYCNLVDYNSNPYDEDTDEFDKWSEGWEKADADWDD